MNSFIPQYFIKYIKPNTTSKTMSLLHRSTNGVRYPLNFYLDNNKTRFSETRLYYNEIQNILCVPLDDFNLLEFERKLIIEEPDTKLNTFYIVDSLDFKLQ